ARRRIVSFTGTEVSNLCAANAAADQKILYCLTDGPVGLQHVERLCHIPGCSGTVKHRVRQNAGKNRPRVTHAGHHVDGSTVHKVGQHVQCQVGPTNEVSDATGAPVAVVLHLQKSNRSCLACGAESHAFTIAYFLAGDDEVGWWIFEGVPSSIA